MVLLGVKRWAVMYNKIFLVKEDLKVADIHQNTL
jgi:hypothetical protein